MLLPLLLLACAKPPPAAPPDRIATILAINDTYRMEGVGDRGGMPRVRALRAELEAQGSDVLVLHAGDLLYPSLLSRMYDGEQAVDALNGLDGGSGFDDRLFFVFGNHEFDTKDAAVLDARIEQSQFTWLGTNIDFAAGEDGAPLVAADNLVPFATRQVGGITVGLFGLTTSDKQQPYIAGFRDPAATAREATAALRHAGAEVVIALTHQDMGEDVALLEALGEEGPDLVIGGHEHNRQHADVAGRLVIKADAEALSAAVVRVVASADAPPKVGFEFRELAGSVPAPDPTLQAKVGEWLTRHEAEFCAERGAPTGCLSAPLATAGALLEAEELKIRRFETNLGDWVTDQMRADLAAQGAQVAFINAGALRLNHDIPAGEPITQQVVEELFAYPTPLKLVRLDGAALQRTIDRSVQDWTGQGHWLQVSGLAFRHDPAASAARDLSLLTADGPLAVTPDMQILAVVPTFLAEGNDGYPWLKDAPVVAEGRDLKIIVQEALRREGTLNVAIDGRICNATAAGPCLLP